MCKFFLQISVLHALRILFCLAIIGGLGLGDKTLSTFFRIAFGFSGAALSPKERGVGKSKLMVVVGKSNFYSFFARLAFVN
jgi:hypothetical protein